MDGGVRRKPLTCRIGVPKGFFLPHVLHEGLVDHRTDLRTLDNFRKRQQKKEKQQIKKQMYQG